METKILVVHGIADFRQMVEDGLNMAGMNYDVDSAVDVKSALGSIETAKSPYDMIILEFGIDRAEGRQRIITAAQAKAPGVKIIIVSGTEARECEIIRNTCSPHGFIALPPRTLWSIAELVEQMLELRAPRLAVAAN